MSSSAIKEIIKEKENELNKLKENKISISKVCEVMDCVTTKYIQAGDFIKNAGDIGGIPFDSGKTAKSAKELENIKVEVEDILGEIDKRIAVLEAEIDILYQQYNQAKAKEEAVRNVKTNRKQKSEEKVIGLLK